MYKLLVFNEDCADEHSVPALAVFTEEEFVNWKASNLGKKDPNYEKKLKEFETLREAYNNFTKECIKRDLWNRQPETEAEKEWKK